MTLVPSKLGRVYASKPRFDQSLSLLSFRGRGVDNTLRMMRGRRKMVNVEEIGFALNQTRLSVGFIDFLFRKLPRPSAELSYDLVFERYRNTLVCRIRFTLALLLLLASCMTPRGCGAP
jgi:hypothetical protein